MRSLEERCDDQKDRRQISVAETRNKRLEADTKNAFDALKSLLCAAMGTESEVVRDVQFWLLVLIEEIFIARRT